MPKRVDGSNSHTTTFYEVHELIGFTEAINAVPAECPCRIYVRISGMLLSAIVPAAMVRCAVATDNTVDGFG